MLVEEGTDALVVKDVRAGTDVSSASKITKAYAMKSDWQTVTEKRQIQQSVTLALALGRLDSDSGPPSALSCLRAFVLNSFSPRCQSRPSSTRILTQRYISSVPPW